MSKTQTSFDQKKLQASTEVLRALAHPLRMRILEFIHTNGKVHVNKIYNTLDLEQSITSQHLRVLRLADLVGTERDGKFIRYFVNYERIASATDAISHFLRG